MPILDMTPKYGGEDGELVLKDPSTIFAYLEDLQRSGAEVRLVIQGHPPLPAVVTEVAEDPPRFVARLGKPLPVTWIRRMEIVLLFTLDGIRFLAPVRFLGRGAYLEAAFSLPAAVRHAERRVKMRVNFGPREKATVTALESLGGARGATGALLDLSMEGLRMRVDRAITVRGRAPLEVTAATFPKGSRFPILRIDQLPYSPIVVCSGEVAHATAREGGVELGMRFFDMGEMESQIIRQVLGRRLPKFNQAFPERKRRDASPARDDSPLVTVHGGQSPEWVEIPLPADPRRAPKRLLVAVSDDLDRAVLVASLRAGGYVRIHEARNYAEAQDHAKVFTPDVVILEEKVGALGAVEFLARIRQNGCDATPTLLLAGALDVRTRALAMAAQIDHALTLGEDFEGALKEALDGLLGF